ncbi:MAG: DEAD/DEAH box helicase [Lachnospirales bacterium]
MSGKRFNEFDLSEEILKAIEDMGFEEATPIQAQTISLVMEGHDVIGQSQTGTGKTAAFGIPCIENIKPNGGVQGIVLCPTRELAIQVCEEFRKLLKYKQGIKVAAVYGGQPISRQIMALKKGVEIIVGTPGRTMDHLRRKTIRTVNISHVILDEADEMLDMGFREDIETILDNITTEYQTILFSATMPKPILEITKNYQKNPQLVKIAKKELTVPNIEQVYIEVRESTKLEALCRLVDINNPELSIVFCNTKKSVDELVEKLQGRGYFAEGLHGDLKQTQRDVVMKKFRNRTLEILVATDVAARGIDVENVDLVFNYDLPQDEEYYVHRIGRTGRAGKNGKSYSFIVGREIYRLKDIMRYTNSKIKEEKPPTLKDIEDLKAKNCLEEIKNSINNDNLHKYIDIIETLREEDLATIDIAAALLKLHLFDGELKDVDFTIKKEKGREKSRDRDRDKKGSKVHKLDGRSSRLFLSVGRRDRIMAKDIVGSIANELQIPGRSIGHIDIYNEFSFIDVKEEFAQTIVKKMNGKKIKGKKVKIEIAKKSRENK